ncbi:MAG: hypothetical protein P8X81_12140 [Woeseiaceae bacterium]|jgi:hypothetical protein
MIRPDRKFGRFVSVLLFALLLSVQTIALAHAYEHDPASFQDTACATCISINQLAAATVDHGCDQSLEAFKPILRSLQTILETSAAAVVPRQRGPPTAS